MRPQRARELGGLANDSARFGAHSRIGVHEPAATEAGVEMQPARDAVDVVAVQRRADLREVVRRELIGVMKLVPVDQLAQPLDGAVDLVGHRLGVVAVLGLIAAGHKAGDHRPEGPDAEARLHRFSLSAERITTKHTLVQSWAREVGDLWHIA